MGNIIDDIRANEDTFADRPFNEVDSLALAQLSYARMPVNVPRLDAEATDVDLAMVGVRDLLRAECYDDMFGKVWSPSMNVDLLRAMCESPRWRDLRVGGYVDEFDPETTKQFSACVFDVGDGSSYVAFRGTDSTIVGWKEDFAMAFRRPVAAQESAARYLADIAGLRDGAVQERLIAVFCHDGPGFDADFFDTPGYARVAPLVDKSVPESSIVGMLFEMREHVEDGYTIVSSDGASIMQHFALNWQVERGEFVHAGGLSASSRYLARTINGWMAKFDDEHRRRFIENLFAVLEAGGYDTFGELTSHWTQSLPVMLAAVRGIDAEDRDVMADVLKGFAATAATSVIATKQ